MLTQKQKDLLLLIDRKIKAVGVPPSYDEMKDALGLANDEYEVPFVGKIAAGNPIDQEEATLKRIYKSGQTIELIPENKDFETKTFGPDRVEVQGILVGLVRKYH